MKVLKTYLDSTDLLLECLDLAAIEDRQAALERLLLPPGFRARRRDAAASLGQAQAHEALTKLCDHDVVSERDGDYRYTVELMHRWVLRRQND